MENIYSEHEASVKNGGVHHKLGAGNGHVDSQATKVRSLTVDTEIPKGPMNENSKHTSCGTINLFWPVHLTAPHCTGCILKTLFVLSLGRPT